MKMQPDQTNKRPRCHVEFYEKAVEDWRASEKAGRPIFVSKEYVRIRYPGDARDVHEAPADEPYRMKREALGGNASRRGKGGFASYKEDFPAEYEAFKSGVAHIGDGTPLDELPFLDAGQRATLKQFNCYTAEDIISLKGVDTNLPMWFTKTVLPKTEAFMATAAGAADTTRLAAENEAMKDQLARMQSMVDELMAGKTAAPVEPVTDEGAFARLSDDDLKNLIAEVTGERPKGNPNRSTLIKRLNEIQAQKEAA